MNKYTHSAPSLRAETRRPRVGLPSAAELAALGTVLCVYRSRYGGELGGWARAISAEVRCGIDSDGWHECLQFQDSDGSCCWRLYLLPESDFLAWEQLHIRLPAAGPLGVPTETIASRLWHRLSTRIDGTGWQSSVVRLHALHAPRPLLAVSPAPVSLLGAAMIHRIARIEGLDAATGVDDCCCRPCVDTHDGAPPPFSPDLRTAP